MADIILGTNDVATLMAGPKPFEATNTMSVKGYLFNAGKKKVWIATHGNDSPLQDKQGVGAIGLMPGLAVPLKVNRFLFYTEAGYSTLLWLPGDSPPVFSMLLATGEHGLFTQDVNTAQALKDLAAKFELLVQALSAALNK